MEIKDVQDALAQHGKAIDDAMKKYDGQLAENGKATDDAKIAIKNLSEKFDAAIKDIGQKLDTVDEGKAAELSAGQEFIKSEAFKQVALKNANSARIEVKNTIVGDATTTMPGQRPGVIPGSFLPLTVRSLIPSINVTTSSVNALREATNVNNAAEVAEGAAKPESDITFEAYDVNIRTIAHWLKVSNQLLADAPAIAAYIDVRLRDGLAQRIERQLILGNGVAPNISGLTDAGNFVAFTPTAGANLADSINKAKYAMWATGNVPDTVIVNPAAWGALETLREGAGTGMYLYGPPGQSASMNPFGLDVVLSNHVPVAKILIGALRTSTMIFQRSGAVVEAGYVNADFTNNLITLRAEERLALAVDRPAGIMYGDITA